MKVYQEYDSAIYLRLIEPLLLKKEACNNLPLGLLNRIVTEKTDANLWLVTNQGEVVYAFMQTPPHNVILPDVDGIDTQIVDQVVEFLFDQKVAVPGVLGRDSLAKHFAESWAKKVNVNFELEMEQLIYQLDQVNPYKQLSGKLEKAEHKHASLIKQWLIAFGEQALEPLSTEEASNMSQRFIKKESVYLWVEQGEPVSMVNQSRKSKSGASINAVFTPDQHKRKGYATAAVAALSQKLLDEGNKFCTLYTDLSNPTSNSIYQKIGYNMVGSSCMYIFK
ncbi:GNAT family N-acetyltransferase [Aquibacillus kalidii]|uniref:GNAT family N-acetyltransferase n=1 Tax=Aquibacillus kalidii TaxID=2762597 RepID=UPI0016490ED6|nr:GNAT family N-acetyltransferase [Aquibacillus kalidii]